MKAMVQHEYGPPEEVMALQDVDMPEIGDDEVLVRVRAAGVNWADNALARGEPYMLRLGYGLRRPRNGVRGSDVTGTVEVVGGGVTRFRPGDEVFGWCNGSFAEYACVEEEHLVPKPAELTFEQAAGIPLAGCVAVQALRDQAKVGPGQKVLVIGASGGIGSFAVQVAKAMGAEVTGVCSTDNVDLVRSIGADRVIDYTEEDYLEGDERYDLILDIADTRTLSERRRALAPNGTLIPNSGEGNRWVGSLGRIVKAWVLSPFVPHRLRPFLSVANEDDVAYLMELIAAGEVTPIVGGTYPLIDAGKAVGHVGEGHVRGKVVVTV